MVAIYKICPQDVWRSAAAEGVFAGAGIDIEHGFIHFSTAKQVAETAARHFAGQRDLVLVAVDADRLGDALRYEPSRGGALFPHLYGPLDAAAVLWARRIGTGDDGHHILPDLDP
ncbi:MAG: DUF952 domain-containing protein [Hyphomicrobiales bacterium]|nr:DUF952 domain-containing protein [Hyphomicrobiales bacterium]